MRISLFLLVVLFIGCKNTSVNEKECLKNFNIAEKLYNEGAKQKALHYTDSTLNPNSLPYAATLYYKLKTRYYYDSTLYDKALLYADSAITTIKKYGLEKKFNDEYVHALLEKGHVLSALGKFEEAKNYYFEGYIFARNSSSPCSLNEYTYLVAMMLYRQDKGDQAAEFFKQSYNYCMSCKENDRPYYRMQELLNNTGLSFASKNQTDSALFYYNAAITFIDKNIQKFDNPKSITIAKVQLYLNISAILIAKERFEEAKHALGICTSLNNKKLYNPKITRAVQLKLEMLYHAQKNYPMMLQVLNDLKKGIDTVYNAAAYETWQNEIYQYYAQTGQYKQAFTYFTKFVAFEDSLNNENKKLVQMDVIRDMNDKEQAYKIDILTKNAEVQHLVLLVTIGFSAFALVIIILVYFLYKRSRENVKTLKILNIKINDQNSALEKSNTDKDRILQVVAHDLRSPIGAVVYMLDMLEDNLEEESKNEQWNLVKSTLHNTLTLTNELLAYKKDAEPLQKETVDFDALVKQSVILMKGKAAEKGQTIIYEGLEQPFNLHMDAGKIGRVLQNIIGNAVKFSNTGQQIFVNAFVKNNNLVLTVKDNGMGIPANLQPQLFDLFSDAKRKGTNNEQSYGLGLSICKQIIEAHGGSIRVESAEGKGSTFIIELPVS